MNGAINTTDYKFNNNSLFQYTDISPTFTNATNNQISTNVYYLSYLTNGTLIIPKNITCEAIIVGAGGRGGLSAFAGGGGAGEVVYYPSLTLLSGVYNIEVGVDSVNAANRISKLRLASTEIIKANGGGDSGFNRTFNTNQSGLIITQNTFYKCNEETAVILNASTYNISFGTGSITLTDTINSTSIIDKSYPVLRDTMTGNIKNPVVWYKFDDNTNLGLDTMGNHNLTNINSVSYTNVSVKGTGSGSFNGTNSYLIKTSGFANLSDKGFTISLWSYRTNATNINKQLFYICILCIAARPPPNCGRSATGLPAEPDQSEQTGMVLRKGERGIFPSPPLPPLFVGVEVPEPGKDPPSTDPLFRQ